MPDDKNCSAGAGEVVLRSIAGGELRTEFECCGCNTIGDMEFSPEVNEAVFIKSTGKGELVTELLLPFTLIILDLKSYGFWYDRISCNEEFIAGSEP